MPPKPKITKDMILHAVLDLTRETGFETVNARSIADRLNCSTQPIFTCYQNMEILKQDFLNLAFDFYEQYVSHYYETTHIDPCLVLPVSYVEFAKEESLLFKLLFISDIALNMSETQDFYQEIGNQEKAKAFSQKIGVDLEKGKEIFLNLFLYVHGVAVLTALGKLSFSRKDITSMMKNMLLALVNQKQSADCPQGGTQ